MRLSCLPAISFDCPCSCLHVLVLMDGHRNPISLFVWPFLDSVRVIESQKSWQKIFAANNIEEVKEVLTAEMPQDGCA